jgi:single-strand DNA-binding protein
VAVAVNRVLLGGNLTRDPQVRFLANEQAVANFGLAINRRFKGSDGQMKDEVTFIDIEAWGRTAELVGQYLTKGRACFVEGRLKLDNWDDKDGQKRSKIKVVADSVQFLDSGNRGAGEHGAATGAPGDGEHAAPSGDVGNAPSPSSSPKPSRPAPAPVSDDEPPF